MFRFCLVLVCILAIALMAAAINQDEKPYLRLAVLDFATSSLGRAAADKLTENFKQTDVLTLDRELVRAAAKGIGYDGSLNLTRGQARDLGATLGCQFYILGDSQTLRRSPATGAFYFESYASLFLVSTRTGNLIVWERPSFTAPDVRQAELQLLAELSSVQLRNRLRAAIIRANDEELKEIVFAPESVTPVIEEAPDDDQAAEENRLQLPRPFRRLRPIYPETAARAEVEATVDVLADIDAKGDVTRVQVERWAGFGLDNSTIETVRQLHFFPALRNGTPIPIRVMLRYNFRKPQRVTEPRSN